MAGAAPSASLESCNGAQSSMEVKWFLDVFGGSATAPWGADFTPPRLGDGGSTSEEVVWRLAIFQDSDHALQNSLGLTASETLWNRTNVAVAERQRDGSQGLQPLGWVRIQGASRSDA